MTFFTFPTYRVLDRHTKLELFRGSLSKCNAYVRAYGLCYVEGI